MGDTRREPLVLLLIAAACVVVSGIRPHDRLIWWLEVSPVLIAAAVLVPTYRRFPLTPLLYRLIFLHALILILGAHYTYARVPVGLWVKDLLGLSRNGYDRLGHFVQGFVPAIVAREVLLRCSPLRRGKLLFVLVLCVCLAVSAGYELVEWAVAVWGGEATADFLGTQGDAWDTQWDMFLCLIGAILAQLALARPHDRALARLAASGSAH